MRHLGRLAAPLAALIAAAGAAAAPDAAPHRAAQPAAKADSAAEPAPAPLPLKVGGSFALIDHTGRPVSDADFRGSYMLVFFGYANCAGICPTGLRVMSEAIDLLGERAERVTPILISVDPARDTPDTLAAAVERIHPRLVGLTGTREQLSAAAEAYQVRAKPAGRSWQGRPIIEHSSFIYLMGPDGRLLALFPPIMDPEAMAAAIARHLS